MVWINKLINNYEIFVTLMRTKAAGGKTLFYYTDTLRNPLKTLKC